MSRFNYDRDGDTIVITDRMQGAIGAIGARFRGTPVTHPIATVYDTDLAERIVKMLNEEPGYYRRKE